MMDERAARAVAGDQAAFDGLAREHYPSVLGFLRRMIGDDAEDATQRTFLGAWRAIATFDPSRPLKPWLLAIAVNEARKMRREPHVDQGLGAVAIDDPLPPAVVERQEAGRRAAALVAELPSEQRSAMLLRFQQGLTPAQIAEVEGVSVNAIRIRITRAVQRLRERMRDAT
jgi:RNA polymerase sigma factor (sigma-70 family)